MSWWRSNQLSYAPFAAAQATSSAAPTTPLPRRLLPSRRARRDGDLADGRQLCFDDVGDPAGRPVLYVHGTPDSRRARHPDDAVLPAAGVRLVAVDRPGRRR